MNGVAGVRTSFYRYVLLWALCLGVERAQGQALPTSQSQLPRYDLLVRLGSSELRGTARITLSATRERQDTLTFALSELFSIARVEVNTAGRTIEVLRLEKTNRPFARPGWGTNTWLIVLTSGLPPMYEATLTIDFFGSGELKSFVFSVGSETAFAAGQTTAWYPEIEEKERHPTGRLRGLRATGDVTFILDPDKVLYTPGRFISRTHEGSRLAVRYRFDQPLYFSFAAGPFVQTGITYYLKVRPSARRQSEGAARVLRALEREFGPHRFDRFAVVEVPTDDAERAGFAGASADGFIMATSEFLDQPFNTAYYGHEIAHQWWGVTVRPSGVRGNWMLTEAMAQYGSLKAVEALDGPALAERYRRDEYPGYLGQGGKLYFRVAADGHDAPLAELPLDGEWSRQLANSKGFMIWNALAREVGAETFRRVLADIVARYSTGRITWDVFLQEVNAGAKRDLSWFYAQWFDRPGVPDWRVEYDAFRNRHVLVQRSPPYRASVRVDILTSRCRPEARRIELIGMQTDLPAPKPNCGAPSYHVDPSFELIHKQ